MTRLANADFATAWAHAPWTDFTSPPSDDRALTVWPVFGFADHGLGLALDLEEVVGNEIVHQAVLLVKPVLPLRVLPPLRFGLAPYSASFFGVDPDTASSLILEVATGLRAAGVHKLVFFVTSPWQAELIGSVSRDVRVELGLQTFVILLPGLGLSFHPTSPTRATLQAVGTHLLDTLPTASRPGVAVEPDFRPGRWDQPAPVHADPAVEAAGALQAAARRLAGLFTEIHARAPLGQNEHRRPLAIGASPSPARPGGRPWPHHRERYLAHLTRDQLEALPAKDRAFVIIPTGSIEQHGPHLPVGVDALLGQAWLDLALPLLPPDAAVWVAPPITFGKSNEHSRFPGTLSVSARTLRRLLLALATQLRDLGFRQLGVLNTHGGNTPVLIYTLREIQTTLGLRAGLIQNPYRPPLGADEATFGFHAGEWETALMLACAPETVRRDRAVREFPARVNDPGSLRPEAGAATFSWATEDISTSGVMGDATAATPENGQLWLTAASHALAGRIAELAAAPGR